MIKFLFAVLFSLCCVLPASADDMTLLGVSSGKTAPKYVGPGDIVGGAQAWYGLRCYSKFYTGSVADVWDSATGSTTETLITCNGGVLTETVHPLATTCSSACKIKILYDQSGNGLNVTQATNANRPTFTRNCLGSLPCIQLGAAGGSLGFGTVAVSFSSANPQSQSLVANSVSAPSGSDLFAGAYGTSGGVHYHCIVGPNSSTNWYLDANGSAGIVATTTNSAWHNMNSLCQGSSSIINMDGTETAGTTGTTATTVVLISVAGQDSAGDTSSGKMAEWGLWNNIAFTHAQRTSLCHNQFAYWGTAVSC